ncbi:MAG: ORF6N domain-containing protein [Coriobacteriales bacterium]
MDETSAETSVSDEAVTAISASGLELRNLIYTVRGMQVMLDSDLAALYGVETKVLNRAAKRNERRFPEDFRFKIKKDELDNLRCQIGTLQGQANENDVGRTYLPYVYTEQGVAMLSAILRSVTAVEVSVRIMRAFVEMRHFIASNAMLFDQIRAIELRQLEYQKTTDERFERVFDYMETLNLPR